MDKKYLIGIDVGGTKCAVVLGDKNATIYDRISFLTESFRGPQYAIDNIINNIYEILNKNQLKIEQVQSMGISCGGPLDSERGLILSPPNLPGWDEIPIVNILENRFSKKTYLQNDANACAVAEWKFGTGKGCKNMIFMTFGTGLGAGLILDGKLYTGTNDMAGEIGHIRLSQEGPVGYGKKGSFEGYCSGGGIAQIAKREILSKLIRGEKVDFCPSEELAEHVTTKDVGIAAYNGDPTAIKILKESGRHLGMGLSILIDILNPEKIIIGSVFARCREFLQPSAEEIIRKEALELSSKNCTILPSGLGEQIGDYACISVALGPDK